MTGKTKTTLAGLSAIVALAVAAPAAEARQGVPDDAQVELRHGADDAAPKVDDKRARRGREAEARRGADDRPGDQRRGRGNDDGPSHT